MVKHLKSLREYIDALKEIGEIIFNNESTNPLVAFLRKDEKMSMHTTKVVYNCLPPDEWDDQLPQRSSFMGTYPIELQNKVLVVCVNSFGAL